MTSQQYAEYLVRQMPKPEDSVPGCEDESTLHADIAQECRRQGWLAFHGSMAHRTSRTLGEPDFVILMPGRVLLIEAKTRLGKQSPDQLAVAAMAGRLGHTVHVIRSFRDFLSLIRDCEAKPLGISSAA